MKKKIISGTIAVSLVVGGTSIYAYNQHVQSVELEQFRLETLNNAQSFVESFYNEDKTLLAEDLTIQKIDQALLEIEKVDNLQTKELLYQEVHQVREMFEVQTEVYSLLVNGVVVDTISTIQLDDISKNLTNIKNYNESIYHYLQEYVKEATNQNILIELATKEVEKAEETLDKDNSENALFYVEEIKNEAIKEKLSKRLLIVNNEILELKAETKRLAEEEKERKEAEEKARVESEQKQVASHSNSSGNSSAGSKSNSNNSESSSGSSTSNSNKSTSNNNSSKPPTTSNEQSGGLKYESARKTGEGEITREDGKPTGRTYTEWTFDEVDTSFFD